MSSQPCCCPLCPHLILGQDSTCTQPMPQLHPPTWRQHSKCKCRVIRGAQHHTAPHGVRGLQGCQPLQARGRKGKKGSREILGEEGTAQGWVG